MIGSFFQVVEKRYYAGLLSHQQGGVGETLAVVPMEWCSFWILRVAIMEHSKLTTLDFGRADLAFFRELAW